MRKARKKVEWMKNRICLGISIIADNSLLSSKGSWGHSIDQYSALQAAKKELFSSTAWNIIFNFLHHSPLLAIRMEMCSINQDWEGKKSSAANEYEKSHYEQIHRERRDPTSFNRSRCHALTHNHSRRWTVAISTTTKQAQSTAASATNSNTLPIVYMRSCHRHQRRRFVISWLPCQQNDGGSTRV